MLRYIVTINQSISTNVTNIFSPAEVDNSETKCKYLRLFFLFLLLNCNSYCLKLLIVDSSKWDFSEFLMIFRNSIHNFLPFVYQELQFVYRIFYFILWKVGYFYVSQSQVINRELLFPLAQIVSHLFHLKFKKLIPFISNM